MIPETLQTFEDQKQPKEASLSSSFSLWNTRLKNLGQSTFYAIYSFTKRETKLPPKLSMSININFIRNPALLVLHKINVIPSGLNSYFILDRQFFKHFYFEFMLFSQDGNVPKATKELRKMHLSPNGALL